jgi:hypothetical protein
MMLRAVALAALVTAGVGAGGFGIQYLALPHAGTGDLVAARASRWLGRYREASSVVLLGRQWVDATCFHGWIDGPRGRDRRGTLLVLAGGASIRDIPPHTLIVRGRLLRRPVALLQAAGCTIVLANRLAELAQFVGGVRADPVHVAGDAAFAVHFPRLTLYVDRRTDRPIGVSNPWGRGRFRLVSAVGAAGPS